MRLFPRRKALTGTPEVLEALANRTFSPYPLLGGGARDRINARFSKAQTAGYTWMYLQSPAVRTVVDLLAANVSQLDLRLYEEIDETERQPRPTHPAALSVRYPNPATTSDLWVRQMFTDFLIFKNAYSLKFRNPNGRISFEYIPARHMEVLGHQLFRPEGYRFRRDDGVAVDIPNPADVFHWRDANPDDPRLGYSPLETLRGAIAEDAALEAAITELAKSGLVSPSWVFRPSDAPEWSNDARERFEEDLTNRLKRSNKAPVVLEEGMELRDVGVSPRDAQMLDVRKWVLQKVASLYGVPLAMVGLGDNIEAARAQFYSDTLPPLCEQFTRSLNLSLLVNEYDLTEYCFEFNLDEKHMGDDRLKALTSASGRPVMLTNEARAKLNLPPVDGGDELVTPANVLVGDKPKPSVDVMPIQDPNKPPQDGSHRIDGPMPVGSKDLVVADRSTWLEKRGQFYIVKDAKLRQFRPRLKAEQDRQFRAIDKFAGDLERFYSRLGRSLRGKGLKDTDRERFSRELGDDLHQRIEAVVEAEADLYVMGLGGTGFDMRQVKNWLRATAYGAAGGIADATFDEIDESGLDEALAHARGERLSLASSSLGSGSIRFARLEAAKQAPHPERRMKVWVADTERHASLNGAAVPLDQSWGGIEPGQPPNCKCTVSVL